MGKKEERSYSPKINLKKVPFLQRLIQIQFENLPFSFCLKIRVLFRRRTVFLFLKGMMEVA